MKDKRLRLDEVAKFLTETLKPFGVSVTLKGVGSRLNIYINGRHSSYIDLRSEELKNISNSNVHQVCRLAKIAERDYEVSNDLRSLGKMARFIEQYGGVRDLNQIYEKNINLIEEQYKQLSEYYWKRLPTFVHAPECYDVPFFYGIKKSWKSWKECYNDCIIIIHDKSNGYTFTFGDDAERLFELYGALLCLHISRMRYVCFKTDEFHILKRRLKEDRIKFIELQTNIDSYEPSKSKSM